jgi:hypothetical protein
MQDFFQKLFFENYAFYGLDTEPVKSRNRNCNLSKVGTGTVTCQKWEPEPEIIVTIP